MVRLNDFFGVFAKTASTTIEQNPISFRAYRDESLTENEIKNGHAYNIIVNSAKLLNEYNHRVSSFFGSFDKLGIPEWLIDVDYIINAVVQKNGVIYLANVANTGEDPETSGDWRTWSSMLDDLYVRIDLTNVVTSGTGSTIALQDSPTLNSPNVGTQPAGTDNDLAASTAFVQSELPPPPVGFTGSLWIDLRNSDNNTLGSIQDLIVGSPAPFREFPRFPRTSTSRPAVQLSDVGFPAAPGIVDWGLRGRFTCSQLITPTGNTTWSLRRGPES